MAGDQDVGCDEQLSVGYYLASVRAICTWGMHIRARGSRAPPRAKYTMNPFSNKGKTTQNWYSTAVHSRADSMSVVIGTVDGVSFRMTFV